MTWLTSRTTRAMLCLGIFALLAVTSTLAYWVDSATYRTGQVEAGSLDIQVRGAGNNVWIDSAHSGGGVTIPALAPGESRAQTYDVRNTGENPVKYRVNAYVDSASNTADSWEVATAVTSVATNTGTRPNRAGSCSGATSAFVPVPSMGRQTSYGFSATATLQPGQTSTYCSIVRLQPTAPLSTIGSSTTIRIGVEAQQVGE